MQGTVTSLNKTGERMWLQRTIMPFPAREQGTPLPTVETTVY